MLILKNADGCVIIPVRFDHLVARNVSIGDKRLHRANKWRVIMARYECGNCGGDLEYIGGIEWQCVECGAIYEREEYDPDEE